MMPFDTLREQAQRRLTECGSRVVPDATLRDASSVALAASRTVFSWKGMVVFSQHLLLRHQETATAQEMMAFFDAGLAYGKSVNRVPLLPGMQFGYMIFPCIAVERADSDLINFVSSPPRQHWSVNEFPVVLDLSTRQMHYFTGTTPWGAFFFSDLRALVERVFEP